jgi:hypothetical protein
VEIGDPLAKTVSRAQLDWEIDNYRWSSYFALYLGVTLDELKNNIAEWLDIRGAPSACGDVAGAVSRESAWRRWSETCKCPVAMTLVGSETCRNGGSRKFNPNKLHGKGCRCEPEIGKIS